jgi:hypothetical protein
MHESVFRYASDRRFLTAATGALLALVLCAGCVAPIHKGFEAAVEKYAVWVPDGPHSIAPVHCEASPPPPGRLHAVPTRPVFGGPYGSF